MSKINENLKEDFAGIRKNEVSEGFQKESDQDNNSDSEKSADNKPDKKKKKKKNKNKSTPVATPKPQNAMAKLAQERLQRVAEETARLKALQDEEDRKIREEEEKEQEEIKAIADE